MAWSITRMVTGTPLVVGPPRRSSRSRARVRPRSPIPILAPHDPTRNSLISPPRSVTGSPRTASAGPPAPDPPRPSTPTSARHLAAAGDSTPSISRLATAGSRVNAHAVAIASSIPALGTSGSSCIARSFATPSSAFPSTMSSMASVAVSRHRCPSGGNPMSSRSARATRGRPLTAARPAHSSNSSSLVGRIVEGPQRLLDPRPSRSAGPRAPTARSPRRATRGAGRRSRRARGRSTRSRRPPRPPPGSP